MTTPEQARRKRTGRWITRGLVAFLATLFLGVPAYVTFGPDPPIRVSKETTHITAPLTPEGLPDYAAAMLADSRKGVTPENNGAVPFVQAMWDGLLSENGDDWSERDAKLVCEEIGAAYPPPIESRGTRYYTEAMKQELVRLYKARVPRPAKIEPFDEEANRFNPLGLPKDEATFWGLPDKEAGRDGRIETLFDNATDRPWTRDDLPCLADWVDENQASLDLIVTGAERLRWFLPPPEMLSELSDTGGFLPASMTLREACRRLNIRAHHHLGEKRHQEAIRDASAILQFGSHLCQEPLLVSQLVGSAIHGMGLSVTRRFASEDGPSAPALRQLLSKLQAVGPGVADLKRSLLHERYYGLANIVSLRRDGSSGWDWAGGESDSLEFVKRFSIDWNEVLVAINRHYDSVEAAVKQPTQPLIVDALRTVDANLAATSVAHKEFANHPGRLLTPAQRGRAIANQTLGSGLFSMEMFVHTSKLAQTRYDLTLLGVSLAVWRTENGGAYPGSLDALTPDVLVALPTDAFGSGPYQYRRTEDGFLLYSVGPNGVDDRGSATDEHGWVPKHEGVEIEVSNNDSAPTPEEKALLDRLELIPDGADDESVRFPLPVTPWPWEKAE